MLTFNEEEHKYYWKGFEIPSTTNIINTIINPTYYPPGAGDKGKEIHKMLELFDLDKLDWASVADQLCYIKQWEAFKKDNRFETLHCELKVMNGTEYYAGTIDRVGIVGDKLTIIDIKTGKKTKSHVIQIAAYDRAYKAYCKEAPENDWLVYLTPTSYELVEKIPKEIEQAYEIFLCGVRIYRYRGSK